MSKVKSNVVDFISFLSYLLEYVSGATVCLCHQYLVTVRKRSLGQGNIFAPVCHSVHRGGTWAGTPLGRYTSRADTPPWAGTPWQVPPKQVTPPAGKLPGQVRPGRYIPQAGTPPTVHAGLRSTSGRYASYWNVFLVLVWAFASLPIPNGLHGQINCRSFGE